jgi:hypothetical protein
MLGLGKPSSACHPSPEGAVANSRANAATATCFRAVGLAMPWLLTGRPADPAEHYTAK